MPQIQISIKHKFANTFLDTKLLKSNILRLILFCDFDFESDVEFGLKTLNLCFN